MADQADTPSGNVPATLDHYAALHEALEAARLLELAEDANSNCPDCHGEGPPENCETCFPLFDIARLRRRRACALAGLMPIEFAGCIQPLAIAPQTAIDPMDFLMMNDRAMRMELVLRVIRHVAMGGIALPGSGATCDWLRDWIDGLRDTAGSLIQGPVGGPLLWPSSVPLATDILVRYGFTRSPEGYVILKRQPDQGEVVQ